MTLKFSGPARRRAGRFAALSAGTALFAATAALAWPVAADGGTVALDNLSFKSADGDSFAIAHVEFVNTNLTKDEVVKLLTPDTSSDDDRALAKKLTAEKISIPSIDILGKDGSKIHLAGLAANHVDAGRIEALDLAGIDASGTDKGGTVTVKSGALHLDGVDVAQLPAAEGGGDAKPSRLGGLTLSGLDVVAPDPDGGPGQTIHFSIGSIDLHNTYDGDSLKQGDAKIVGVAIEPSPGSEAAKSLASFGYSKIELAVTVGASYQAGPKSFTLSNFAIDGAQMGAVGLKANFTDVAPSLFSGDSGARMQALLESGVASVEVKLTNAGLFDKALAYYAKQQGTAPDKLRAQWSAMVGAMTPALLAGSPSGVALAAEAQKFIADPKTLTVNVKAKSGALKAGDFMAISDPTEFVGKLDISAAANQ